MRHGMNSLNVYPEMNSSCEQFTELIYFLKFLGYSAPLIKVLTEMWILPVVVEHKGPAQAGGDKDEHFLSLMREGKVPKPLCRGWLRAVEHQLVRNRAQIKNSRLSGLKTGIIHKKPPWIIGSSFTFSIPTCPKPEQNSLSFGQVNLSPFLVEAGNVEGN